MPSRIGGNEWCRLVDDDTYRLHAIGLNEGATVLRWTGVHLPSGWNLMVRAWCAINESLPVRVTLEVISPDGTILRGQHIFDRPVEQHLSLSLPPKLANPLRISIYTDPLRPLKSGERAVIDVAPIKATPYL